MDNTTNLEELFGEASTPVSEASPEAEVSDNGSKSEEQEQDSKDEETPKVDKVEKEQSKEESAEDKPSVDWDADDNPYKKRYEDTQKWGNESHQAKLKLEEKIKKFKEEYGIEDDEVLDESQAQAELNGRIKASDMAARQVYGEDVVQKTLYAEDSLWSKIKHDPLIDFRVKNSQAPVFEAMQVVKEHEFFSKYSNNPDKIVETIKKEVEKELRAEITKEYKEKLKQKKDLGSDLSKVKDDKVDESDDRFVPTSTDQLFG